MCSKMLSYFIVTLKLIKTKNKNDLFLKYVLLLCYCCMEVGFERDVCRTDCCLPLNQQNFMQLIIIIITIIIMGII